MSQKQSSARGKGGHGPSSSLKQVPIFATYSTSYSRVYEMLVQSVRHSGLDDTQMSTLAYSFDNLSQDAPTGWRTSPWYQAQRQKLAYFRDQLPRLAERQVGIFADADLQLFPNLHVLQELLETMRARELDMMFIGEYGGPQVNPGVFLAANTPGSRAFLEQASAIVGAFNTPLPPPQTALTECEPEPVFNRLLQRTPKSDLRWSIVSPQHVLLGGDVTNVRWNSVLFHHAICASGAQTKLEQMGRVRHAYFNWKYTEATGFPMSQNFDPMGGMPRIPGGVWVCKTEGKLYTRDEGGIETRNPSVIKLLTAVHEKHPDIADFSPTFICTQDTPGVRAPGMNILAFSKDKRAPRTHFGQDVIAVPDNVFDHWRNAGMPDYEETCALLRAASHRGPQKNVAGWIGNAQMHPSRVKLLELARQHPAELEAINTGIWKQVPNLPRFEVGQGRYHSLPEQVEMYAFFLDVEGNGWSGRLKLLFHSGRPVLMQERPWEEFYFSHLKPFEHYVPVAADMSDLVKQVQWLQGHPEEGDRIARNAQAFAMQHLTRAAAIETWAKILRTLSATC